MALFSNAFALKEDTLFEEMQLKIKSATDILQNKTLDLEVKEKKLFGIFDPVFDFTLMSKLSLGKQWNSLNDEQKRHFLDVFEKKLKKSYIEKLNMYNDQVVKLQNMTKVKANRIEVLMHIIGKDETYEIIYKFYRAKDAQWFIYDVDILGISIVQTYRNQFVGVLQKDSFDELMKRLNQVKAIEK